MIDTTTAVETTTNLNTGDETTLDVDVTTTEFIELTTSLEITTNYDTTNTDTYESTTNSTEFDVETFSTEVHTIGTTEVTYVTTTIKESTEPSVTTLLPDDITDSYITTLETSTKTIEHTTIVDVPDSTQSTVITDTDAPTTINSHYTETQQSTTEEQQTTHQFFTESPDYQQTTVTSPFITTETEITSILPMTTTTMKIVETTLWNPTTQSFTYDDYDSTIPTTMATIPNGTLTLDCHQNPCKEGGTCMLTSEGAKCVCSFDFKGAFCEEKIIINRAAFSGDSYLSHKIYPSAANKMSLEEILSLRVTVKAQTRSSDGLLMLTTTQGNRGGHYMALFLRDGLLQFQFSCGIQTMLLSEIETRINTGQEIEISAWYS